MNIADLARKLKVSTEVLRNKLPELGFDVGIKALKIDDRVAGHVEVKWKEYQRLEREKARWKKYEKKEVGDGSGVPVSKDIVLPNLITVRDFAAKLYMPVTKVIRELMNSGILASMNDFIDFETASIVAEDLGFKATKDTGEDVEILAARPAATADIGAISRPPVVVIMGHVDHGKTSLLDKIRETNVVKGESGGITQHIGAYQAEKKGQLITFIDTPGHEAFTAMRSRGARIADIAVLVVAADDGIQPQTREALKIIQAAHLPFFVAFNKIDKPDINLDRIKGELAEAGLTPEDWGGKTVIVPVSAKSGLGVDTILDTILLLYELDKKKIVANPKIRASGTIIESHVDPQEGVVATMLVQSGTLRVNDYLGHANVLLGKVRAMRDWNSASVREAAPSVPVRILGFKLAPQVGDIIDVPEDHTTLLKKSTLHKRIGHALPTVAPKIEEGKIILNIIIRADVLGSLEAILSSLEKLEYNKLAVKVIAQGLGNITENDIRRAETENARIYGFHVLATPDADSLAREKNIPVKLYEIIYDLFDAIKKDLESLLPEEIVVTYLGKLKIKGLFRNEKDLQIIGGVVLDGKLRVGGKARLLRAGNQIGEATISELQLGKRTVQEVPAGTECGLKIKTRTKVLMEDELEVFWEEKRRASP